MCGQTSGLTGRAIQRGKGKRRPLTGQPRYLRGGQARVAGWHAERSTGKSVVGRVFRMAIFHLSAKVVSRGKGQSAIAKAAYNSRSKLEDERTGLTKDYSRNNGDVMFSGIFAPKNAPEWVNDRQQLWNEVERREDRSTRPATAQLAREIEVSLPHELSIQEREWLVKDFVREQITRKGMIADVNIHAPHSDREERNYHAHILVTMRSIGPDGFGPKVREWNDEAQLEQWRERWEHMANKQLERHGHDARIDRRTLEAQGIDRQPTTHRGPHVDAIERRGVEADNTRENYDRRAELAELRAALSNITRDIAAERNERAAEATAAPERQPEAANNSQPEHEHEPAPQADRDASAVGAGAVAGIADALAETVAKVLNPLLGNGPTPPPTKEAAEALKQQRLEHAERMLHDREYRRRYEREQEQQKQRDMAVYRQRKEDDERGRSRQR